MHKGETAMRKSFRGWTAGFVCALVLFVLACRAFPAFARAALDRVSIPAMAALHGFTARVPFPVAEPAALILGASLLTGLFCAVFLALSSHSLNPLRRWCSALTAVALVLIAALILLWVPARAQPVPHVPQPDGKQLTRLCEALIEALNRSPLDFPAPRDALARAPAAAGLPDCAVKAVRYPEWMDLCHAWGLFVPLTGEALADAAEPAPLIPFTAVHELMHLAGVADEGAANVAAWGRCMDAGGPFADSARLWALRYAMGPLRLRDGDAWLQAAQKMNDALKRVYMACGGDAGPARPDYALLIQGDYAALACHLASGGAVPAE